MKTRLVLLAARWLFLAGCLAGGVFSTPGADTLIATGSNWKYLDNGTDQGTAWRARIFNDSSWTNGPAQLGYGDGDEARVVSFGPDPINKYITTYFRYRFYVSDPSAYSRLMLRLLRDDGAVVYLNGTEVFRSNMPTGAVNYLTQAPVFAPDDGTIFFSTNVSAAHLVGGTNAVAVEIHQQLPTSSDISFDLELTAELGSRFVVTNTLNGGPGSLRWAISNVNLVASPGRDMIEFNIPGAGPHVIQPVNTSFVVSDSVVIDGRTQPGYAGLPVIHLDGSFATNSHGLVIGSSNCVVAGLAITRFNSPSAAGLALTLSFPPTTGNWIHGNHIGLDTSGTNAAANTYGIGIFSAHYNLIGTDGDGVNDVAERNLISGNDFGLVLFDAHTNRIAGNFIGTDRTGTNALGNGDGFFYIDSSATGNIIGTDSSNDSFNSAERNVISGNLDRGIILAGPNRVSGNFIGTDPTGVFAVPNGYGIQVNEVGSVVGNDGDGIRDDEERNVISGNFNAGIAVRDLGTRDAVIRGNYIGTRASGLTALPNGTGLSIFSQAVNTLVRGNVISGNLGDGVAISGASGSLLEGNLIGLAASGGAALGNAYDGVYIISSPSNTIGGVTADTRNFISGNGANGVSINYFDSAVNVVAGNTIGLGTNGNLTLGNGDSGVFINDAPANIIGAAEPGSGPNVISGNGTEGVYIGGSTSSGNRVFNSYIGLNAAGTAARPNNQDGVLIDNAANNTIGDDTGLPTVISGNAGSGVTIEGLSSSGNLILGCYIGLNAAGTAAVANGEGVFIWDAPGNFVGDPDYSVRNVISGNLNNGVRLLGTGCEGNNVKQNFIGTSASGTNAVPNGGNGVHIDSAPGNQIGYSGDGDGDNVISGNSGYGIFIFGAAAVSNQIEDNYVGTDDNGTAAVPNAVGGIGISVAPSNYLARNLISGNGGVGVFSSGNSTVVQDNDIGTDASGEDPLPNAGLGISLISAFNRIGGTNAFEGNTIAYNFSSGVQIAGIGATNNAVLGNNFQNNGGLGIDLVPLGVTPNDPGDADPGPNHLQNFPALTSAINGPSFTPYGRLEGTLNSRPSRTYRLEFFGADLDPSGHGEGRGMFALTNVTTSGAGNASFRMEFPARLPASRVTATATDPDGNTSEFSASVGVASVPRVTSLGTNNGPGGSTLTITGTDFSAVGEENLVFIDGVKAEILSSSSTQIIVAVPANAALGPVTVVVNGLIAQSARQFSRAFPASGPLTNTTFGPLFDAYEAGGIAYAVAMADLDGDGQLDLAAAHTNGLAIYRNTATPGILDPNSFAPRLELPAPSVFLSPTLSYAQSLATGDLDGDGKLDLVAGRYGHAVSVYRNTSIPGTNSFETRKDLHLFAEVTSVALADMDGDGRLDILYADYDADTWSILRNLSTDGQLLFAAAVTFSLTLPISLAAGDLDGDGKPDVAVTAFNSSRTVSLYRNATTPGSMATNLFSGPVSFAFGTNGQTVAIADLDNDGKQDLAVGSSSSSNIFVLGNLSTPGVLNSGSFALRFQRSVIGTPYHVVASDLDGDGRVDLAATLNSTSRVAWLRNVVPRGLRLTNTSFTAAYTLPVPVSPRGLAIGDLDGDGPPDLALATRESFAQVALLRNTLTAPADIVINEFMANNLSTIQDPLGEYEDWIEIYNPMPSAVDLSGWSLTDALNNPTKFTFPPGTTLAAGEYRLIWADNELAEPGFHASFLLSSAGGSVGLSTPNSFLVQSRTYLNQTADISEGRLPNATGPFTQMLPTPGAVNQLAPVVFINGQIVSYTNVFATNQATVAIVDSFGADLLFYTLDGSDPALGQLYTGPFVVSQTSFIRAVSYSADFAQSAQTPPILLTVFKPPVITLQPQSAAVALGDDVTFSAAVTGSAPLAHQWYKDGLIVGGATAPSLTRSNVVFPDAGAYTLRASNPYGAATSAVATLTVVSPPMILSQPTSTNVALGTPVTLCVVVTNMGNGPFFYQWRRNGVNIPGATNSCFMIPSVQLSDGGTYTVVVRNAVDALTSNPATLVILNATVVAPGDNFAARVLLTGNAATVRSSNLTATVEMGEPLHGGRFGGRSIWFRWTAPTNGIATFRTVGSTFDTLLGVYTGTNVTGLTSIAQDEDSGGYLTSLVRFNALAGTNYAIAVDGLGGAAGIVLLDWSLLATNATIPVILVQPVSKAVLVGSNASFTVTASGTGLLYQWRFNGIDIPGATNVSLVLSNVQFSHRGFYSVIVRNALGNAVESVRAQLQVGLAQGVLFVDKLAELLPANTNQGSGGGFAPAVTGGSAGFTVGAGITYDPRTYNTLGNGTDPGEGNHCGIVGGASGWLPINTTNSGRLVIQTVNNAIDTVVALHSNALPCISCTHSNVLTCNDDAATGVTYSRIEYDVPANGSYLLAVDGKDGAAGEVLVAIALGSVPTATTVPVDEIARVGGRAQFGVTITGGAPAPACHWYRDGAHVAMTTNSVLPLENIQPENQGLYSVLVSNLIGTVARDVGRLFVDEDLRVVVSSPFDMSSEGWTNAGPSQTSTYRVTGGNPGGNYETRINGATPSPPDDTADAAYWRASAGFLGNKASAYGGWLEYDLKLSALETLSALPDVLLEAHGARLVFNVPQNATLNWTLKRVPLTTNGWHIGTLAGPAPTCEQMTLLMGGLTNLFIRAQYRTGLQTNAIDNVALVEPFSALAVRLELRFDATGQCYVEWPASAGDWILESADDPACFLWMSHPTVPQFLGGKYAVPFNPTALGPHIFFRLRKP